MWRLTAPLHFFIQVILWPIYALALFLLKDFRVANRRLTKQLKAPFVVVANHDNTFDPFLIGAALPYRPSWYPFFFAAKKSLMHVPLVGQIIWALGAYSVPKGVGLEKSMAKTLALVRAGHNIMVFPQGRIKLKFGRPRHPRRGIAYLVKHLPNVPILPVRVKTNPLKQGRFFRGRLNITFGQPFTFAEMGLKAPETKQELNRVANAIMARVWAL